MKHDVVLFGEALLRIQPEEGGRIEDAPRFAAYPGGAELNTACALASLGLHTAFFSKIPEGPLGARVLRHLRAAAVDDSLVRRSEGRLGTYWVEYGRDPRSIDVLYDRAGSTVCSLERDDVPWDALRACRLFFVSGITPALSSSTRDLALEMARVARDAGATVVTDLNYRARLWTAADAAPVLEQLARTAHTVIAPVADLRLLYGMDGTDEDVAHAARSRFGAERVVLTLAAEGALCVAPDGITRCEVFRAEAVDRVGAGDAFVAGLLYATLTGRQQRGLEYGLAMAALKLSLRGDNVTTSPAELEQLVRRDKHDIRR